ncbi:MAG: type II secretion system F family protein [Eubacterium sp.]|nr:type II secretion system F family protein [Eubacterium sp.]
MIQIVGFGVLLIVLMLAIISRKNFSKYKDGSDPLWWVAGWMTARLSLELKERVKNYIRRTAVLNEKPLEEETDRWFMKNIHTGLVGLILLSLLVIVAGFVPEKTVDPYVVERPDIKEESEFVELKIFDGQEAEGQTYKLEIHSREYSQMEFQEVADQAREYIDKELPGQNEDIFHVRTKLNFPLKDETGTLKITWDTDKPQVVDFEGNINKDNMDDNSREIVGLSAKITDGHYIDVYQMEVTVLGDEELVGSELAKLEMLEIEEKNRSQKNLQLPQKIGDVYIERSVQDRDDQLLKLFALGIIIIILWLYYKVSKLKEAGSQRTRELENEYFSFVNRLTIYIGAGMSLKKSIEASSKQSVCVSLREEVGFTLNKIESGASESSEYIELGKRLGSGHYSRLMSLISQNLAYGNTNLLKLLDSEVRNSFYMRREMIRKKGEQASEKLLLPTGILLGLVMILVIYPALIGI